MQILQRKRIFNEHGKTKAKIVKEARFAIMVSRTPEYKNLGGSQI